MATDELLELLRVLSHDVKNPLSALLTNLHYLASEADLEPDAGEALSDSLAICAVLERLVSNLDVLARGSASSQSPVPTSLRQLAQATAARMAPQATAAGLRLEPAGDDEGMVLAAIDRDLATRALENLVANALEHAPSGSTVRIEVRREDADAVLAVVDSGPIVPEAQRKTAVSMAGQLRAGRAAEARYGRGLGLLCADVAARAAGGRLELGGADGLSQLRIVAPAS